MKIKRQFICLLVSVIFLISSSSLTVFATDITGDVLDLTIKQLGGLADKGENYVTADKLIQEITISDKTFSVEGDTLYYHSEPEGIIDRHGDVTHGLTFKYVTVTPVINDDGTEIYGSSEKLLVMPYGCENPLLFEDFEDFDTGSFGNGAIGTTGWTVSSQNSSYNTVDVLEDDDGDKYLKFANTATGNNGNLTVKHLFMPPTGKNSQLLVSFKAKIDYTTNSTGNGIKIGNIEINNGNIKSYAGGTFGANLNISHTVSRTQWHDFCYIVDYVETPQISGVYNATLYIDGVEVGSGNVYNATDFALSAQRNYIQGAEIDNIYIQDITLPISGISLGDIGEKYVVGDTLRQTITIGGEELPITYESSNEDVISSNGSVVHSNDFAIVSVIPKVTIDGEEVKGDTTAIFVLPTNYDVALAEDFEGFQTGEIQRNTTVEGWNLNNYTGDNIKAEVISDGKNKYFSIGVYGSTTSALNPTFSKKFNSIGEEDTYTIACARIYSSGSLAGSGNGNEFAPFGYFKTNKVVGGKNSNGNGTEFTVSSLNKTWHDYIFVVDNDEVVGGMYKKASVYVDGTLITDSYYSVPWQNSLKLAPYRGEQQFAYYDELLIINMPKPRTRLAELEALELSNKGSIYFAPNKEEVSSLPQQITITEEGYEGTYPITYVSSDETVIRTNGTVNHNEFSYSYVNVRPTIEVGTGEVVKGKTKSLVVLPKNIEILFEENFENATDTTILAGGKGSGTSYNGWFGDSTANGANISITTPLVNGNRLMSYTLNSPGFSPNPSIYNDFNYKETGGTVNCISFRVYYEKYLRLGIKGIGYLMSDHIENDSTVKLLYYEDSRLNPKKWYTVTLQKNGITGKTAVYIDGDYQGEANTGSWNGNFGFYCYRFDNADVLVDDIIVSRVTDIENLEFVRDNTNIGDCDNVTENITLPPSGAGNVNITWDVQCSADVAEILDNILIVKRSPLQDQTATLIATFTSNGTTLTREYNLTIKKISELEAGALIFSDFSGGQKINAVNKNIVLPSVSKNSASISWESLTPDTVTITNGTAIISRHKIDKLGILKAVYSNASGEFTCTYRFTIQGIGKILYEYDFSNATSENQDVSELNDWAVGGKEMTAQDKSVNNVIIKNPQDILLDFADARKALKVERFATSGDRKVSNDKAMCTFGKILKSEQTTYDFDFMFLNDGRILAELYDMQMTFAITKQGVGIYGKDAVPFDKPLEIGKWYRATILIDSYIGKYDFYLDHEKVCSGLALGVPGMKGINFYSNAVSTNVKDAFLISNIVVRDITPSAQEAVNNGVSALEIGDINYESAHIDLPCSSVDNTYVTWDSSDESVISADGVVTRTSSDTNVVLTATVSKGDISETKSFTVRVNGLTSYVFPTDEIMEAIAESLTFDKISDEEPLKLTKNLNMIDSLNDGLANEIGGISITWESDSPAVVSNDGHIRMQQHESGVTLTATITSKLQPSISTQKKFVVAVRTDSAIYYYHDFEDCTEELVGEPLEGVDIWPSIKRRAFTSGTEYGLRQYVYKAPGEEMFPLDRANKVVYLDRVLTSNLASIPELDYFLQTTKSQEAAELYAAKNAIMSFKFMFEKSTTIRMTTYVMSEYTWEINLSGITRDVPRPREGYSFKKPLETGKWYELMMFFDLSTHTVEFRLNGERVGTQILDMNYSSDKFQEVRIYNDSTNKFYIDDFCIRCLKDIDHSAIVADDYNDLTLPEANENRIELPTIGKNGSKITWSSSNTDVISDGGVLYPSPDETHSARLTALIRKGDFSETKIFDVSVPRTALPYRVDDILLEDGIIKFVDVTKLGTAENVELVVLIYDRENLISVKNIPLTESGNYNIMSDVSGIKNGKITAFVWDRHTTDNKILSNKKSIRWEVD